MSSFSHDQSFIYERCTTPTRPMEDPLVLCVLWPTGQLGAERTTFAKRSKLDLLTVIYEAFTTYFLESSCHPTRAMIKRIDHSSDGNRFN